MSESQSLELAINPTLSGVSHPCPIAIFTTSRVTYIIIYLMFPFKLGHLKEKNTKETYF